ncbi:MAG: translation elongation factor Ts [Fimbriimonadaceae bacterium]
MANYTAADVKKLRDETGAPMMECKAALDEADGNLEKAKEILRIKGKAAAAKRADRSTSEGVVAIKADGANLGAVVVEVETDFVARNEEFIAMCNEMAEKVCNGTGDEATLKEMAEGAVARMRENCQVTKTVRLTGPDSAVFYVHHDRKSGAIVTYAGEADAEVVRKVAVHATASRPKVVSKDQLSQEDLAKEYEVEYKRAIEEGKPANIAENMAKGRVNKEFVRDSVLLEQPFYADPAKTVSQYLTESAKGVTITSFTLLAVGG